MGKRLNMRRQKTIDAVEVVRCKDCIHKPVGYTPMMKIQFGFDFPDDRCPCRRDNPDYSYMPDDDFFCAYGERKQ